MPNASIVPFEEGFSVQIATSVLRRAAVDLEEILSLGTVMAVLEDQDSLLELLAWLKEVTKPRPTTFPAPPAVQ